MGYRGEGIRAKMSYRNDAPTQRTIVDNTYGARPLRGFAGIGRQDSPEHAIYRQAHRLRPSEDDLLA
jgi:hypothetical protein